MTSTKTRTLLQTTAVLVASILLLGCPISEDDLFTGDVEVVNNTGASLDFVNIHEATSGTGANFGALANATSVTYSGYDCATSYINTVRALVTDTDNDSVPFIPPCSGTETVTWDPPPVP